MKELPYNKLLKECARELRKAGNLAEVLLWQQLKGKQFLGLDFTRQQVIGSFIADFYCDKLKLVIEIDGGSHVGREEYDASRDTYMESLGIKVVRILDNDVRHNMEGVLRHLENLIRLQS